MNRYTTHNHNMDNFVHYYTIQVILIPIEDCSQSLRDCTSCAASMDPLCGWCSIEKKCSRRSECSNNTETRRWIQEEEMCMGNFSISPNALSAENINQKVCFSHLHQHYVCVLVVQHNSRPDTSSID